MSKWRFTNRDDEGPPDEFYRITNNIERDILDCIVNFKINRLTSNKKMDPKYGKRNGQIFGYVYEERGIRNNEEEREKLEPEIIDALEKNLLKKGVVYRCWYQRYSDGKNYPYWHTDFKRLERTDYNCRGKYSDDEKYKKALRVFHEGDFENHEIEDDPLREDELDERR